MSYVTLLLLLTASVSPGRKFYVSPGGDDSASGLSVRSSWKTLQRVSRSDLRGGDEVILQGDAIYPGPLVLKGGDLAGAVTVRSQGKAAVIESSIEPAITLSRSNVILKNLELKSEPKGAQPPNIGILMENDGTTPLRNVSVSGVKVSGFGGSGIALVGKTQGFHCVKIAKVVVARCKGTGLTSDDALAYKGNGYAHRDLLVTDSEFNENGSSSGIVLSGIDGARVEFCRAAGNAGGNGGLGMWAWAAKNVTFRYCVSSGTRTIDADGGGFDLDGGCVDCVVEHCLSFDNNACGYMHCDYPDSPPTKHNVIRDSVSIDDGARKGKAAPSAFGFVNWGSGLEDCMIEGNIAIITDGYPSQSDGGALFATFILNKEDKNHKPHIVGCAFIGNTVDIAKGVSIDNSYPESSLKNIAFQGNRYRCNPFIAKQGETRFTELSKWEQATGQGPDSMQRGAPIGRQFGDYSGLTPRQLPKFLKSLSSKLGG